MRSNILLECTLCKRKNCAANKNKQKNTDKVELKKFCKFCRKHTVHREGK
ncbi:MAG: 50S ribosomal protein L33 [Deltaproteobacteria bacterium]|nr:50S ribosomal protein L33 [Deltaproteobacteria bacterium]